VGQEGAGPAAAEDFGDTVVEGSGPEDLAFEGFELHYGWAAGEAGEAADEELGVGGGHEGSGISVKLQTHNSKRKMLDADCWKVRSGGIVAGFWGMGEW
jgi:hypothetical protein